MTAVTHSYLLPDIIHLTASTVNQVINAIFTASTYNEIIRNLIRNSRFTYDHFNDLKNDLFMYLLEEPEKTVEIYNRGQMRFFFTSIAKRQICSDKSKLFGRYILTQQRHLELLEEIDTVDEEGKTTTHIPSIEYDIDNIIDRKDAFNYCMKIIHDGMLSSKKLKRNLTIYIMFHIEDLSIAAIVEKTGINETNTYKYLRAARKWVDKNIDHSLFTHI